MKYESAKYLSLTKEFETAMKDDDFDSSKKLSLEIERIKIEDQNTLLNRKESMRANLLNKFKEQQRKELEHFKMMQESELIKLQNKWVNRLEYEQKKIN